ASGVHDFLPIRRPVMACASHPRAQVGCRTGKVGHRVVGRLASRLMSPLGRLLRRHREQARLTQEELADRAGVSARTISDNERGVRARAYADTATRLSGALGLTDTDRATFLDAARGPNSLASAEYRVSRVPQPITS